jgi:hypothetical protein
LAPNKIIVALIDSARFSGTADKSSYVYEDHKLKRIKLSIDTQTELRDYIQVDFANDQYTEGLISLLEGQSVYNSGGRTLAIDPERYKKGFTLFCFDLTQAMSGTSGDTFQSIQRGNLRLHIEFSPATTYAINCYFLMYFDSELLITADRQVLFDFNT